MSSIKPKNSHTPNFEALNNRRKVGHTYGERRQKTTEKASQGWMQSIKDRFFGARDTKNIGQFTRNDDRYTHSIRPDDVVRLNKTVEGGRSHTSKSRPYSTNQHVRFLDSVIAYVNTKKASDKV